MLDTAEEEPLTIEAEPLILPGELDLPTDIEPLELPGEDGPTVPPRRVTRRALACARGCRVRFPVREYG